MSLLFRLVAATRSQMIRTSLNPVKLAAIRSSQAQLATDATPGYDEEADDRDRFKHDDFYNRVVMIGTPVMISILICVAYWGHTLEHHFDQDEYVEYPYLCVRRKPLPWGDGNHSLFHNPEKNWVPGVGYEKKQEKSHH